MKFDAHGQPALKSPIESRILSRIGAYFAVPNISQDYAFVMKLPNPGLYLLVFTASVDRKSQQEARDPGAVGRTTWTTEKYVIVN